MIFVSSLSAPDASRKPDVHGLVDAHDYRAAPGADLHVWPVEADWKIVVAQLLESRLPNAASHGSPHWRTPALEIDETAGTMRWSALPGVASGASGRPRATTKAAAWHRRFLWPNMLIEQRSGSLSVLQVQPGGAGRSRVQQFEYRAQDAGLSVSRDEDRVRRLLREQLERELGMAASTQQGLADPGYEQGADTPSSPAAAAFGRMWLAAED